MKKSFCFYLITLTLCFAGAPSCSNNALSELNKKYHCTVEGEAEPRTSEDYAKRGLKHINELDSTDCGFDACSEALRLDDKNALAYGCRGYAHSLRGQWDLALKDFDQGILLDPNNPVFYSNRSRIYREKGQYDKALPDAIFVIKNSPPESPILHHDYATRGEIYFNLADYENALKDYTQAIKLKPDYLYHYDKRAETYRKLNKNDLAAADEAKSAELEIIEKSSSANKKSLDSEDIQPTPIVILNSKAKDLPKPVYPRAAKAVGASGKVMVSVEVDEKGNVTSAKAYSGHPLLQASAESAARQAKFNPTLVNGKPVKIDGVLTFDFVAE